MFTGPFGQRPAPRHLAGAVHSTPAPAGDVALEADELEVAPLARVHRSRLAFALAVTLAALPVVVLDNLPATAETSDARVQVQASADESSSSEPSTTVATTPSSTTTTEAPTTTAAPVTTTTEAPTATEAAVVQALRAPAPTTTAPPTTAPPTTAPPRSGGADPNDPATWDRLARCESFGNWNLNSGNGYYGGLQFSLATWRNVGGTGYPHQATKAEQIKRGKILQARAGWDQWPYCSERLGYT